MLERRHAQVVSASRSTRLCIGADGHGGVGASRPRRGGFARSPSGCRLACARRGRRRAGPPARRAGRSRASGSLREIVMPRVADDADHFLWRRPRRSPATISAWPTGFGARPRAARGRFVHDDDCRQRAGADRARRRRVPGGAGSPSSERYAGVTMRNSARRVLRRLSGAGAGRPQRVEAGEGQRVDGGRRLDPGQRCRPRRDEPVEERGGSAAADDASIARKEQLGGDDVTGVEAEGPLLQAREAAHEETRRRRAAGPTGRSGRRDDRRAGADACGDRRWRRGSRRATCSDSPSARREQRGEAEERRRRRWWRPAVAQERRVTSSQPARVPGRAGVLQPAWRGAWAGAACPTAATRRPSQPRRNPARTSPSRQVVS